jgi:dipeptidyl aminopeptidase/acylaminoacyl peptidase
MPTECTPELLADYESPQSICISPSGNHVVYTLRPFWVRKKGEDGITASLWTAEVDKEHSARQLTSGKYGDSNPKFSPDSKWISFVSDRATPGKGGALYVMPFDGPGEGLALTKVENEKGVGNYKWSPDGKRIAFISADEKSEEKKKRDDAKDDPKVWGEEWEFSRLRVLDFETRKVETLFEEEANVWEFDWSDDGQQIAIKTSKTPLLDDIVRSARISTVNVQNRKVTHLYDTGAQISSLIWCGKHVWWCGQADDKSMQSSMAVYRIEPEAGSNVKKVAYGDKSCARTLDKCNGKVVAYVEEGLHDLLDAMGFRTVYKEEIDIGRGWDVNFEGSNSTVVVIKQLDTAMPLEVFSIVDGKQTQLSKHAQKLADCQLGEASSITCRAKDGLELHGVLVTPKNCKGPFPTVLTPHGGPYSRVTRGSDPFFCFAEWFLAQGYAVLLPNYRGGSGRGAKFAQAVIADVGVSHADCVDLLQKGIELGAVDKNKVAVAGWSQGGFHSFLAPTQPQFHFVAAIPGAGISNWETMSMTSDLPQFEGVLAGDNPWKVSIDDVSARRWSALFHMKNINTPYLILHGENDQRVPVEQSIGFHRGMLALGKQSEMVIYPREGHGLPVGFERNHYIHMLNKMKDFLAKHMK